MIEGWYSEEKLTTGHSLWEVNPFTGDQDRISPYNINTISSRQVMRIEKNINHGIISWSNTKFSENKIMNKPDETWFSPLLQYSDGRLNVHHKQSTIRDMAE